MKNKIYVFIIVIFTSTIYGCIAPTIDGGHYPIYKNRYGYAVENDVLEGIKLKKAYPTSTPYVADYSVSSFGFEYYEDNIKNGNPVVATENNYERFISLQDDGSIHKVEFYNDMISFGGYYIKYGNEKITPFIKQDYVITNFQDNSIFFSDNKQAQIVRDLPILGTSLRLNYSKTYKDAKYLTSAYFLEGYPQKEKVITFAIPSYLNVEIIEMNFEGFNIEKSNKKYTFKDDLIKNRVEEDKTKDKVRYVTYIMKNVIGLKAEKYKPGYSHNHPHLVILVKSVDNNKAKKFSKNSNKETKITPVIVEVKDKKNTKNKKAEIKPVALISNLNDLYAHYSQIVSTVNNDSTVFKKKIDSLIKDKKTDFEKIETIFYWVQDNIRYVAYEDGIAGYKPDACQNVFNNRFGDCKGMGNLLKQMLKSLGYDARLTWIGTKHLKYDYSIPSLMVDNHMICTVFLNGKKYFLDGTENYIGIDDYADRIQGRPVLIEDGNNFIMDTIPDFPVDRNSQLKKATFKIVNGVVSGTMNEIIKGENKTNILRSYHSSPKYRQSKVIRDIIDPDDVDIDVSNITTSDLTNRNNDIEINYNISVNNHLLSLPNGNLLLKTDYKREFYNTKTDSARFNDLQFNHKLNYVHDLTYQLPDGYIVESLPKNFSIDNPEFNITITYEIAGNQVKYYKSIKLKKGKISKSNFTAWNSMINDLQKCYNQYVTLKKI